MVRGFLLTIILTSCARESLLTKAEAAFRGERYEEALELYDQHREERQKAKNRPDWENPSFYHLIAVDSLIKLNRPEEAEKRIVKGIEDRVDNILIVDKLRIIALWYARNKSLKEAIDFLDKYQYLDEEYIDGIIDQISKDSALGDLD